MADADFSYIVSSLPDYVKNNGELISKQIAFGTPTVKRVTPMTDVKYKAKLNYLGLSGNFQNGRGCATEYNSTATLTDRDITTAILERKWRICPDTLLGKWPEYLVRIPADKRDELPFEAYLVAEIISEVNDELETLVWQGDATKVSDPDLISGYLTIVGAEATRKSVSIAAGTSHFAAVRAVIAALPAKLLKKAVKVFVAPEFFTQLSFELVDANLYHFNPGEPVESLILPGTNVEIINTPGLANSGKIFASVLENMYYASDDTDAQNRVKIGYNDEKDYFYAKVRFNAGVQVAFPDWCCIGTIQGDLVTPDANAQLSAIATAAAAIAENTEDIADAVADSSADLSAIKTSAASLADADHVYKTKEQTA